MRMYSVYLVECVCGEKFESSSPRGQCAKCDRFFVIEGWGTGTAPPEVPA